MSDVFSFESGRTPLLISVPHDGRKLLPDMLARITPAGRDIPDTDWHVAELYDFAKKLGASLIVANYSRYVVDLNRSPSDEVLYAGHVATGLCPEKTFAGHRIYLDGDGVDTDETVTRIAAYWRPYHDRLAAAIDDLKSKFGYCLLWDAHSIPSCVPRLFDGKLPVLNVGTFDGLSVAPDIAEPVIAVAEASDYQTAVNDRFKGGHITRHYGAPDADVHAIQMEIAQRAYMDEETRNLDNARMSALRDTLQRLLRNFMKVAESLYT